MQRLQEKVPEILRLMSCEAGPADEHNNVYPPNRANGNVQPIYRERPQPGTPNAARIPEGGPALAVSPAHGQRTRGAGPPNDMQTPPRGQRAAQGEPVPMQRVPSAPSEANRGVYRVGQPVELYSKSQQAWCRGTIDKVEGNWVHICYSGPEGQPMNKIMPNGHEEIRAVRAQGNDGAELQKALAPALLSSSAPPPRPQAVSPPEAMQGPGRSPLQPLQAQGLPQNAEPSAPGQPARYPGATVPQEPGFFNVPGLTMPENFRSNAGARPLDSTSASLAPTQPDLFGHLRGGDLLGGSMRFQRQQPGALGQQQGQPQLGMPQAGTFGVPQQGAFGVAQPGTFVAVPQPATPKKSVAGPPGMGSSPSQFSPTVSQPMCQSPSQPLPQAQSLAAPCGSSQSPQARPKYQEMDIPNRVPLVAGVEKIEPEVVHQMLQSNAGVLVDLRGDDRSVGIVPGAIHCQAIDSVPFMQKIPGLLQKFQNQPLVVFTCQYSAHRAPQCANWYREQADARQRVAIMSGGFRGWQGNGLPVESLGGDAGAGDKYAADAYALLQGVQFAHKAAPAPTLGPAPALGSYVAIGGQTAGYGLAAPMGFSPQRFG